VEVEVPADMVAAISGATEPPVMEVQVGMEVVAETLKA
jgi:hypothetical protein